MWQNFKDIPPASNNGDISEFNGADAPNSFNFKTKITSQIGNNGTKLLKKWSHLKTEAIF